MARKLVGFALLTAVAVGAYVSAPMVAAWQIREAVRSGNTAKLQEKVDWPSVRKSLRVSLDESRKVISELTDAAGLPRPGIWQRIKMAAVPFLADPLIGRYVTAEGVSKLYAWRQKWGRRVQWVRATAHASTQLVAASVTPASEGWLDRLGFGRALALVRRVKRWAFVSPIRFEIELADRIAQGRTWQAALELRGLTWKLTEMRVAED
jgi:hypothetical protein